LLNEDHCSLNNDIFLHGDGCTKLQVFLTKQNTQDGWRGDGDEDEDDKVVPEGYEEVLGEEDDKGEAKGEVQDFERGAKEKQPQQQDVEGEEKRVEGLAGLSEWFRDIAEDAQCILDHIQDGDDVPIEALKS
jgi:hypothetical protein